MKPGSKVLYLGGAAGTTVSHVSDLVGPQGCVYAVEFSHRPGRDLINMAKHRTNVIPIIEDARHPLKYRMLVGMVDCVFADVAQPDQARIVALNSQYFLEGGRRLRRVDQGLVHRFSPLLRKRCLRPKSQNYQKDQFKPKEQLTLEPHERDHAVVVVPAAQGSADVRRVGRVKLSPRLSGLRGLDLRGPGAGSNLDGLGTTRSVLLDSESRPLLGRRA